MSLHWLAVSQRIDFKISLLPYKALNGLGPKYMLDLLVTDKGIQTPYIVQNRLAYLPRTRSVPPSIFIVLYVINALLVLLSM